MFRARRRLPRLHPALPLVAAAALIGGALVTACGDDGPGGSASAAELVESDAPRAEADVAAAQQASAAVQAFATDLYAALAAEDGNVVFSPYSAAIALAMTRAGAEGDTATEMEAVLHAALAGDLHAGLNAIDQALARRPGEYPLGGDGQSADLELSTANQLWAQRGWEIEDAFLDQLATNYGAGVRLVDYAEAAEEARNAINTWVAEQTRDRIPELVPEGVIDELTRLVLTNAIYLNAPWLHRFDENATAPGPFMRSDGTEVEAQMMGLSERLRYGAGDGFEAVELPYIDGSLAMVVVVPEDFASFEAGLDAARLDSVVASLGDAHVDLKLPKFEFRTQAGLKDALTELGMPDAFDPALADFSGINAEEDDLHIQDVIHEAFISVDEHGTEAAAATAVVMGVTSAPAVNAELTVDRPFLFLIRDTETGALLFMGRVLDPTEG